MSFVVLCEWLRFQSALFFRLHDIGGFGNRSWPLVPCSTASLSCLLWWASFLSSRLFCSFWACASVSIGRCVSATYRPLGTSCLSVCPEPPTSTTCPSWTSFSVQALRPHYDRGLFHLHSCLFHTPFLFWFSVLPEGKKKLFADQNKICLWEFKTNGEAVFPSKQAFMNVLKFWRFQNCINRLATWQPPKWLKICLKKERG